MHKKSLKFANVVELAKLNLTYIAVVKGGPGFDDRLEHPAVQINSSSPSIILQGDIGGPLVHNFGFQDQPKVVAIATNINSECSRYFEKPGVFTLVGAYREWILDIIELHGLGTEELERIGNSSVASIFHIYHTFFLLIVCFLELYVYL